MQLTSDDRHEDAISHIVATMPPSYSERATNERGAIIRENGASAFRLRVRRFYDGRCRP